VGPDEVQYIQVQGLIPVSWQPLYQYKLGDVKVEHSLAKKDLGVLVDASSLKTLKIRLDRALST